MEWSRRLLASYDLFSFGTGWPVVNPCNAALYWFGFLMVVCDCRSAQGFMVRLLSSPPIEVRPVLFAVSILMSAAVNLIGQGECSRAR